MALYGYLVVTAVFAVYIFVAGFINSFGVFVDQFDRSFCQPNDCLDILGKSVKIHLCSETTYIDTH